MIHDLNIQHNVIYVDDKATKAAPTACGAPPRRGVLKLKNSALLRVFLAPNKIKQDMDSYVCMYI